VDYQSWRTAALHHLYAGAIRDLVARYRRGRPTVVLLPGGMGSELDRSLDAHSPRAPSSRRSGQISACCSIRTR
jgi:hypothetical protein